MKPTPTIKQLRYLAALAETGHFGRAADQCAVTQSTLSAGIQDLEEILDIRLVDRSRRQVTISAEGWDVVERARRILSDVDDLVASVQTQRAPLTGALRLGVIPTIAPFLLPKVLPVLRARFPKLELFLREDQTHRLIEQLETGRLDVLLLAFPFPHPDLTVCEMFDDPLLLCRQGGEGGEMRLADLDPARLLLLEDGHCLRDQVIRACRIQGPRGVAFQPTSLHTLVQMVASGLGSTLVPRMAVEAGLLDGTTLEAVGFEDATPARTIGLAWRPETPRGGEYRTLAGVLSQHA